MKIKFLGTGAAEGIPAIFCECDICEEAKRLGGKNIRTRSQALIDGKILIDFPPDSFYHMIEHQVNLSNIQYLLITHEHSDHLYLGDLEMRKKPFAHFKTYEKPLTVFAHGESYRIIKEYVEKHKLAETRRVLVQEIQPNIWFNIEDYEIMPLRANHPSAKTPVMYLIKHKDKVMLYAHDTSYFLDESFSILTDNNIVLDLISLDCTSALLKNYRGTHMSLDVNLALLEHLRELRIITYKTTVVVNHFSHNGLANYDTLVEVTKPYGIIVSYDGLEVAF